MIDRLEETVHGIKTPGLTTSEIYMLTHKRLNTYLILIFGDLNKAQIYKMPYRGSPHHEIEIVMSFIFLNLFKPDEHTEDYYIRGPNDKNFLFEIEDKKYIYVGENLFSLETTDKIVEYSSNDGFNDVKYTYAHGIENIYFMLYQKKYPS